MPAGSGVVLRRGNVSLAEKIDAERGYTADDVQLWMIKIKAHGRSACRSLTHNALVPGRIAAYCK